MTGVEKSGWLSAESLIGCRFVGLKLLAVQVGKIFFSNLVQFILSVFQLHEGGGFSLYFFSRCFAVREKIIF